MSESPFLKALVFITALIAVCVGVVFLLNCTLTPHAFEPIDHGKVIEKITAIEPRLNAMNFAFDKGSMSTATTVYYFRHIDGYMEEVQMEKYYNFTAQP